MTHIPLDHETNFFKACQHGSVLQINLKEFQANWIIKIDDLCDYLSFLDLVTIHEDVKVVLLFHQLGKTFENINYFKIVDSLKQKQISVDVLQKFFEIMDKYILFIVKSDKFFVDVHAGNMILDFFMMSFACDYRILADNTILKNLCVPMGIIPKGTCVFLMRKIFNTTAYSLLLTNTHHKAYDLLRSGLVNQVVEYNKLENKALEVAKDFAARPSASLTAVKQIMNNSFNQLNDSLQIEDKQILRIARQWQN
ncbi:MAG: hypothetical protein JXA96_00765 [Sedimentisphaerales bacterium]|nr:hypothetical protein [Sedimentisphaerales bacterium]